MVLVVRDCEAIRKVLVGDGKWTVVGQSYGGFCATTYLSLQYVWDPAPRLLLVADNLLAPRD